MLFSDVYRGDSEQVVCYHNVSFSFNHFEQENNLKRGDRYIVFYVLIVDQRGTEHLFTVVCTNSLLATYIHSSFRCINRIRIANISPHSAPVSQRHHV